MKERLEALYKEVETLLNLAPIEDDCTEEENSMYSDMANLKESMFDAGFGRWNNDFNSRLEETDMSKWMEIRNDYCNEDEGRVYIDAWKTSSGNEEGKVIAKVDYKTKEIEYLNEAAKTDEYAQEVIKEVLDSIDNGDYEECQ